MGSDPSHPDLNPEPSPDPGVIEPGRYGAIDIGTITCRLLVADVDGAGGLSEIARAMRICNLGVGVDETGRLDAGAIERVVAAVSGFIEQVRELEDEDGIPITLQTIATSASRDAENADEFRASLEEVGVVPQIIPGEREAALSFAGAASAFPGEPVVVVDVGGGSTEIIAGSGEAGDSASLVEPRFAHSFDIGCRRMTERFLLSDPPTLGELDDARDWVRAEMGPYIGELRGARCFDGRIIAVAGTATSAVTMRDAIVEYDPSLVHGVEVSREDVDELLARLAALPLEERRAVPGLEPERAPVIVAGMLILQQVLDLAQATSFTVSERDILHGIILDMASRAE